MVHRHEEAAGEARRGSRSNVSGDDVDHGPGSRGAASRVMIPAPTYERFTAPSSRQAFLLGCCHLGCTRFDGVSEAMLQTLLCSGCRRTRYCSVGCQRAAWVEGHGTYCGKA